MAEAVNKEVVITFTAKNLVKETADEIQINMRGVAWQVQAAAYSIGELNKVLFNNSAVGKEVTGMLHGLGAALRIYTIVENMAKTVGVLTGVLKAQEAAEWTLTGAIVAKTSALATSIATHISHAAVVAASTLAEWAHTAALYAKAVALSIVNALLGPWGWAILAGAAAAATAGIALASRIPSRQFGGLITQEGPYYLHASEFVVPKTGGAGGLITQKGPYYLHAGEYVVPKTNVTNILHPTEYVLPRASSGAGSLTLNVDARGSTFASDYDVDKMMNRVVDRLKRAGVVER